MVTLTIVLKIFFFIVFVDFAKASNECWINALEKLYSQNAIHDIENLRFSQSQWENKTTDPNVHNNSEYVYIVTSVESGSMSLESARNISRKSIISASLISQDKRTTLGNVGYILKVPSRLILGARHHNIGLNQSRFNSKSEAVEGVIAKLGSEIDSPRTLLDKTPDDDYNEVVIAGSMIDKEVEVVALFIKSFGDTELLSEAEIKDVKNLSRELKVPIVKIEY